VARSLNQPRYALPALAAAIVFAAFPADLLAQCVCSACECPVVNSAGDCCCTAPRVATCCEPAVAQGPQRSCCDTGSSDGSASQVGTDCDCEIGHRSAPLATVVAGSSLDDQDVAALPAELSFDPAWEAARSSERLSAAPLAAGPPLRILLGVWRN